MRAARIPEGMNGGSGRRRRASDIATGAVNSAKIKNGAIRLKDLGVSTQESPRGAKGDTGRTGNSGASGTNGAN